MGFDPTTLAQVALATQVGGAATSAVGSYYSAKSNASAGHFAADMAGINARVAELGAQSELMKGDQAVGALTLKAGQVKSAQRVAMAANGIDLSQGNAAEVAASTDLMKETDANTIKANAVRSAWGYRAQATNLQNEAKLRETAADSVSPITAAATSLMGSATNVASGWYAYQKNKGV